MFADLCLWGDTFCHFGGHFGDGISSGSVTGFPARSPRLVGSTVATDSATIAVDENINRTYPPFRIFEQEYRMEVRLLTVTTSEPHRRLHAVVRLGPMSNLNVTFQRAMQCYQLLISSLAPADLV